MADVLKEQIIADLQKAKSEGKLRTERIREIVKSAVSQAVIEVKAGTGEIRTVSRNILATVIENLQAEGEDLKEEVTAAIEGIISGISQSKQKSISQTESEIKQLQAKVEQEEADLQAEIDTTLVDIGTTGDHSSSKLQAAINSALESFKTSEEFALMRKRYGQLQAQLEILQANLKARYGERHEEVEKHLENAKGWYENTREKAVPATEQLTQKQAEFEGKMSAAGIALARKEKRVKAALKDLWQAVADLF
jgi:DNA repair exonuclease SbcCD ATPase subunit